MDITWYDIKMEFIMFKSFWYSMSAGRMYRNLEITRLMREKGQSAASFYY